MFAIHSPVCIRRSMTKCGTIRDTASGSQRPSRPTFKLYLHSTPITPQMISSTSSASMHSSVTLTQTRVRKTGLVHIVNLYWNHQKSISIVELRRSIAVFTTFLIDNEQVKSDWHWRSQYWHCSPCQFNYKYITHLQNSAEESNWLFREFGIENKTYLPGQYEQLPGQTEDRKHSEFYFRHMPKKLIKRIYREQFSRTVKRYF